MGKLKYAPILVSVYDREGHFRNCIESLQKCPESKDSVLVVTSDFPKNENSNHKIQKIRQYINSINGFKKVIPIFFESNVGCDEAHNIGRETIFNISDRFISMEDDIVVSPNFLTFMNSALDFYEKDPNVFSISGFSPNILYEDYIETLDEVYFSNSWNAWGFASWKNKFKTFLSFRYSNESNNMISNDLKDEKQLQMIKNLSLEYYPHFLYCTLNNILPAFDHHLSYYCLKNNFVNVYNNNTYAINNGHDGSGLHTINNNKISSFMNVSFSKNIPLFYDYNYIVNNEIMNNYSSEFKVKVKVLLINLGLFDFFKKLNKKLS